jgi:hypothetical protein
VNTKSTPSLACFVLFSILITSTPIRIKAEVVAYWRFEEGAANAAATGAGSVIDSSGYGFHGTPVNGPVYRSSVPPFEIALPNAESLEFNGVNQRVLVQDDVRFRLTQSLTIEAFIFNRPLLSGVGGNILFRGDDRFSLDPYRLTVDLGGNIAFQVMNASGEAASVAANVPYNQWLHVAGVLDDSDGSMKLYVNGALANSTTTSIRPFGLLSTSRSPGLGIGGLQSTAPNLPPEFFNGFIDELRLSNTALLPGEFLVVPEPASASLLTLTTLAFLGARRRFTESSRRS